MTDLEQDAMRQITEHAKQLADTLRFVDQWLAGLPCESAARREDVAAARRAIRTSEAAQIALDPIYSDEEILRAAEDAAADRNAEKVIA